MMRTQQQDQHFKVFYELSALVLNILRSPPTTMEFSDQSPVVQHNSRSAMALSSTSRRRRTTTTMQQITPAGFASLLLGIVVALMLCGSVTFFIGFLMMPWVLGLVMFFYLAGIVSCLAMVGRAIFCHVSYSSPPSPRKDVQRKNHSPSWKI